MRKIRAKNIIVFTQVRSLYKTVKILYNKKLRLHGIKHSTVLTKMKKFNRKFTSFLLGPFFT